jgi:hypothetical protein
MEAAKPMKDGNRTIPPRHQKGDSGPIVFSDSSNVIDQL